MSILLSDPSQASKSPINTSTSKQQYSFPKQKRFLNDKKQYCNVFYDTPDMKDKRSTSLGMGQKVDLAKVCFVTPAPNRYNMKGEFEKNLVDKRGSSFGLGRNEISYGSIFNKNMFNASPGPAQYTSNSQVLNYNICYTMRQKIPDPEEKQTNRITPGPGKYTDYLGNNSSGLFFYSKYKNPKRTVISPLTKQDSKVSNSMNNSARIPGPQAYNQVGQINKEGKYFVSKFTNSQARTFGHSKRDTLGKKTDIPGPGTYKQYSDFGSYELVKKK